MGVFLGFAIGIMMVLGALYSASKGYTVIEERQQRYEMVIQWHEL